MKPEQIYNFINESTAEILGETVVVEHDLSNIVDIGKAIFDNGSFDAFSGKLVDKVGRVVFVDRKYSGFGYSLMRDGWEYASVMQKINSEMPKASVNESYDLVNGASYDNQMFYGTPVDVKFYNKYVTFEIDKSITERQLKSAFNSAGEMNAFISMLYNEIDKAFTVALSNLAHNTVNNAIAETVYSEYGTSADWKTHTSVKAINLLKEYNTIHGSTITRDVALTDVEFLKYAAKRIKECSDRLTEISTLFNVEKKERFSPRDKQHVIMLSEFRAACDTYMQSSVFHNDMTALPAAETCNYWQGSGTDYAFNATSTIKCKTTTGNNIDINGVVACIFDRESMGINCMERWTRTAMNAKADFTNYFYKMKAQYFNDLAENMIVFYLADAQS